MVATIKFTAKESGVVHDGTSMIVMNKGKMTEAPASAEELLRDKGYISGKVRVGEAALDVGNPELDAALARAEAAEKRADELAAAANEGKTSDLSFELGGFTLTEKGGGHFEITGPDDFEPVKVRGVDAAKDALLEAIIDAFAPPAKDEAPAA